MKPSCLKCCEAPALEWKKVEIIMFRKVINKSEERKEVCMKTNELKQEHWRTRLMK